MARHGAAALFGRKPGRARGLGPARARGDDLQRRPNVVGGVKRRSPPSTERQSRALSPGAAPASSRQAREQGQAGDAEQARLPGSGMTCWGQSATPARRRGSAQVRNVQCAVRANGECRRETLNPGWQSCARAGGKVHADQRARSGTVGEPGRWSSVAARTRPRPVRTLNHDVGEAANGNGRLAGAGSREIRWPSRARTESR
jgi:hypothetical protein